MSGPTEAGLARIRATIAADQAHRAHMDAVYEEDAADRLHRATARRSADTRATLRQAEEALRRACILDLNGSVLNGSVPRETCGTVAESPGPDDVR